MASRKKAGIDPEILEAEIGAKTDAIEARSQLRVHIDKLRPNPDQPRKTHDAKALEALEHSIQELGILQPLLVRPHADGTYQIICGERRFRAATALGLTDIPVVIRQVQDDLAVLRMAYEENVQREDLSLMDEASFLHGLIDKGMVKTQRELAKVMGVSEGRVSQKLQVLKFPETLLEGFKQHNFLTEYHARALAKLEDEKLQRRVFTAILRDESSARRTETLVGHLLDAMGAKNGKQSRRGHRSATFKDAMITKDRKHYTVRVPLEAASSLEDLAELLTGLARALKAKEVHL